MEEWWPGNFVARKRACSPAEVGSDWCSQPGAIWEKDLTIRASTRCFSSCQFHGPGHWRNTSVAYIVIMTESERLSCTTTSTEPCPCSHEWPRSARRAIELWDTSSNHDPGGTATNVHRRPPTATPFTGQFEGNFFRALENCFKFSKLMAVFNSLPAKDIYVQRRPPIREQDAGALSRVVWRHDRCP